MQSHLLLSVLHSLFLSFSLLDSGPFEKPPPPVVQWSLPLSSWLKNAGSATAPKHGGDDDDDEDDEAGTTPFEASVCMQRPGDVVVLPNFHWHSTASVGYSLGFGSQKQVEPISSDFPPLIQDLWGAYDGRGWDRVVNVIDALFAMLHNDRWNIKIMRRCAAEIKRESRSAARQSDWEEFKHHREEQFRAWRAKLDITARKAIKRARELSDSGAISRQDDELVRAGLEPCLLEEKESDGGQQRVEL